MTISKISRVKAIVRSMDLWSSSSEHFIVLMWSEVVSLVRSAWQTCHYVFENFLSDFYVLRPLDPESLIFRAHIHLIAFEEAASLGLKGRRPRLVFTVYTSVGLCLTPTCAPSLGVRTWLWFTFSIELTSCILIGETGGSTTWRFQYSFKEFSGKFSSPFQAFRLYFLWDLVSMDFIGLIGFLFYSACPVYRQLGLTFLRGD